MIKKRKIAFFPIFADTLPIIRYYQHYREDIEVTELISFPGSCACGKDASYLDNREPFGMIVKSPEQAEPHLWEELFILDHAILGVVGGGEQETLYHPMIAIAQKYNKSIRIVSHGFSGRRLDTERNKLPQRRIGKLEPIKKYTVFVGGVIGAANSFEVFLKLYGELSKHLEVAALSSSPNASICDVCSMFDILHDRTLDDTERAYRLNDSMQDALKKNNANLLLIHIEEAMMPYNDMMTNGFGIVPFVVSQLVVPDYSICCLPFDCVDPEFIKEFAQGLEGKFNIFPDIWHISNMLLDHTEVTDIQTANVIYTPIDNVEFTIKQNEDNSIGTLFNNDFLSMCVKSILDGVQAYRLVEIIS